ncbi:hypothetical protein A3H22_03200 [Candidatus Peribacteria bacterium RIFCSPLOWO2_12_FULL_55_15]|nr:MAG: hypothetical protein A2789_03405 [Candidatus Peribacteria bacterium RIFCSPHIGHO2_01_FULL_54_22]OGJ63053.1 MAG: hypothetical protein A3D12_00725 [Candidatus Peribacteria bacterium RIFCSPHIGHO2_02_FULL_55_24]OGJ65030.1 MAG: hypothetical protein A3E47_01120 [Candidatus Peribacteria bacterium RIFCSPHIGHO2_12_FULL_54_10]OGJ68935.1 MAG: hypothetical protein A2947_03825 [Candidatus Peribacteria bacterium RIFCSPLOWO2_01_FULL_54_110]OGJ69219.1 MAG: hypothetical protein A3H90_02365 [Candidatus Pe
MSFPSTTEIYHVAKLARLTLTDAEVERLAPELASIIGVIDLLKEVDTKNVILTAQNTGLTNVLREDTLRSPSPSPDALLSCSPLPLVQHQIQTPSAHG